MKKHSGKTSIMGKLRWIFSIFLSWRLSLKEKPQVFLGQGEIYDTLTAKTFVKLTRNGTWSWNKRSFQIGVFFLSEQWTEFVTFFEENLIFFVFLWRKPEFFQGKYWIYLLTIESFDEKNILHNPIIRVNWMQIGIVILSSQSTEKDIEHTFWIDFQRNACLTPNFYITIGP